MTAAHVVAAQERREADLTSVGRIERATAGTATINDETLVATKPPPTVVHDDVPCSVGDGNEARDSTRAGQQVAGRTIPIAIPVRYTDARRGDTFIVTAVGPEGDPALIGVPFTIDEIDHRSRVVLRRLHCIDTRGTNGRLP